ERNIRVRGHYLASGRLTPQDAQKFQSTPEALRTDIFSHIKDKLPALGHRVAEWDVINHMAEHEYSMESIFGSLDLYVDIMKQCRADLPGMPLWVNEGTILPGGLRREHYENTIRYLMDFGATPDGIGMMGQFTPPYIEEPEAVYQVLDRFAALIPHLQLTELVISMNEDEALQADYLRDIMTIAFSHPAMEGILLWGFWEGRQAIPQAALYRKDWSPKPAAEAWNRLVFQDWWTDETGVTGRDGCFSARGFFGEYEIRAENSNTQTSILCDFAPGATNISLTLGEKEILAR
ncbi:MAG: endo-1,4-beta-xylanase, partial [Lentisphaerota bacterium]